MHNNYARPETHAYTKTQCSLPSLHIRSLVIVFLCFPIELFSAEVTCSFSLVGPPQLSVAALWQTSAASSSAQASQGITRAAWTAAGEFNSLLASVCRSPSVVLSFSPLLSLFLFCSAGSDVLSAAFYCIVLSVPPLSYAVLIVLNKNLLVLCMLLALILK